jgi:hypothetical protein
MMICFRYLHFPVVLSLLLLFSLPNAFADNDKEEDNTLEHKWFLTVYGGLHAQKTLGGLLTFQATFPDDTYIAVAALGREFWRYKQLSLEVEGQVGKYFGQEHQWQLNALLVARWHLFPWNKYIATTLAVGDGISYNTEISKVEEADDEDAGLWLNYLMFELTLGLPKYRQWDVVVRIHHRSEVFGLIGAGGSNFLTAGIKYSF